MVDLEQQIKAWADASAPQTGESIAAADVIDGRAVPINVVPIGPRRSRGRWLVVAAAVAVVGALGIGLAVTAEEGPEQVHASDPPTTSTTADLTPLDDITFEVLGEGGATEAVIGALSQAQTPSELSGLWTASMRDLPEPDVDLAEQVVVSMTIDADGCPPTLSGFLRTGTSISPRFLVPGTACEQPAGRLTLVVAIDWASVGDAFTLVLPVSVGGDDQEETMVVTRRLPTATTTTTVLETATTTTPQAEPEVSSRLELDATTVAVGGELHGTVVVVNNSGEPITGTTCGDYFIGALKNDEYRQGIARKACLTDFTIPEGTSTYPIVVTATVTGCTPDNVRPAGSPPCELDGSMPPFPPGEYQLVIDDPQLLVPAITPVTITVT